MSQISNTFLHTNSAFINDFSPKTANCIRLYRFTKNKIFFIFFLKSINFDKKNQTCIKINTIYSPS